MIARMSRRTVFLVSLIATAISFFTLGVTGARRSDAAAQTSYESMLEAIRSQVKSELGKGSNNPLPEGTAGAFAGKADRESIVAEIKQELQNEMGLLPVHLLRDRRSSFVELYSSDNQGKTNYGTAGYLGKGYFITVKHAVVALKEDDDRQANRRITSIKIVSGGKEVPARVVDAGVAGVGVHSGDWAIIKTAHELDLPSLHVDTSFGYD